jgi:hypothetical protein
MYVMKGFETTYSVLTILSLTRIVITSADRRCRQAAEGFGMHETFNKSPVSLLALSKGDIPEASLNVASLAFELGQRKRALLPRLVSRTSNPFSSWTGTAPTLLVLPSKLISSRILIGSHGSGNLSKPLSLRILSD